MTLLSIATVSLSGTLEEKLRAIAGAGFKGVEIFEADFLSFPGSPRELKRYCDALGLHICAYQPLRDFEGMAEPHRARNFIRAERKFDLMQELGTDLLLICSNVSPDALGGIDRAAADLRELGERAQRRGLRVGFEALAWGAHVNDYRDAWEVVRRADHPAIGLVLDSFHACARKLPLEPIRAIPGDKIFLVQLADAPRLELDVLSWSRHFRSFPGQGDLPLHAFMAVLSATGYQGPLSLEIFNDQFRAGSAQHIATDGLRSLLLLQDDLSRAAGATAGLPPRSRADGVEFVEFAADPATAADLAGLFAKLGFSLTGRHRSKAVERWSTGAINFVINTEAEGFAHAHYVSHGPGVCAICLKVGDAGAAMTRADALLAKPFYTRIGPDELEIPAIRGVGGSLIYFVEPEGKVSGNWHRDFVPVAHGAKSAGLTRIDHLAQSMPYDEMLSWLLFYGSILDLKRSGEMDIADPGGLVRSQAMSSETGELRLVLNGSAAHRTLSARFLSEFFGSGVQHIAFETADIFTTVAAMRARGLEFLPVPGNYYDDIEVRYALDPALVARLRESGILYDREGDTAFFQIYTPMFAERFFFEIVERRGYQGYGAVNAAIRLGAQTRAARPFVMPRAS